MNTSLFGQQFENITHAFESIYKHINEIGKPFAGTKAVFNASFTVKNVLDREIKTPKRRFKKDYAEFEWSWYESGNRDAAEISERAKIWKNMMIPGTTEVNSNYGYFWKQNGQLDNLIQEFKQNPESRRAVLIHYDLNELPRYKYDTPCNLSLNFYVLENKLHLTVFARSIDIYFGLCNDFYCFSKLMEQLGVTLGYELGDMNWLITNLHIYEKHFDAL
jgi:thymidylate synthase